MQTKLQELTDKIYHEGVQKARDEEKVILKKAHEEAASILAQAQADAEKKLQEAQKKADELKHNVEAEMKLTASQAMSALKQNIASAITLQVVKPSLQEVFGDKSFIQELLKKVVQGWTSSGNFDLKVILPQSDQEKLETFFKNSLAEELNKGITFEFDKGLKAGFKIGPKDGSYIIGLSDEEFEAFFKAYLRPKTTSLLFEK